MSETIRTFIAIELPDVQRNALGQLEARLKRERAARTVRWVAAENIHLTLKFLGNVDAEKMSSLQTAVASACSGTLPFILKLEDVGAFPNMNRPNVIWVGVQGQVDMASELAQKIEDACAALGFPREERGFAPHLTLGRVQRDAGTRERQAVGEMLASANTHELGGQVFRVERISIMKSELRPTGSLYSQMTVINFL